MHMAARSSSRTSRLRLEAPTYLRATCVWYGVESEPSRLRPAPASLFQSALEPEDTDQRRYQTEVTGWEERRTRSQASDS